MAAIIGSCNYRLNQKDTLLIEFSSDTVGRVSARFFELLPDNMREADRQIGPYGIQLRTIIRHVDGNATSPAVDLSSFQSEKQKEVVQYLFKCRNLYNWTVAVENNADDKWNIAGVFIYVPPQVYNKIINFY